MRENRESLMWRYFVAAWEQGRKGKDFSDTTLPQHTALNNYITDLEYEIRRLKERLIEVEAKLPRWIPVGERLPEGREGVLVCLDNIKVRYGYHLNGGWYEYTVPMESYGETVTHWMPRPEKPERREGRVCKGDIK